MENNQNHLFSLRPLQMKDAVRMLEWMRDETVTEFLRIGGKNTSLEDVQKFIASAQDESENLHRAIVDENDVYYGTVSLKHIDHEKGEAEYAIAMHMDGIGKGISAKATALILKEAYRRELKRVYLCVKPENARAVRFYTKGPWQPAAPEKAEDGLVWFEVNLQDYVSVVR